jgi:hypothetical protein
MLAQQPRLLPLGADAVDAERAPRDQREGEGGAKDLPASLALSTIDDDDLAGHDQPFTRGTCRKTVSDLDQILSPH